MRTRLCSSDRHLPVLALVLLLACSALGQPNAGVLVQAGLQALVPGPQNASNALVARGDGTIQLRLCECERATGPPNGLSCDKEGWFISSFERQGQWVAGGGYVPLSHAICCRPCLPAELPPDSSGRIPGGQKPLAVISLGCHATTDVLPTRCELGASSFVAGYAEAIKVFTTPDTYYPINTAQCCTPALLLENGDAWELERCGCHDSHDPDFPVSCGGTNTDELLLGYIFFRLSPLGHVVPVGPAQCCRACLSSTVHPMNQCDDLNACSGHGVCNMRRCECFDGWTGADCSQGAGGNKTIPPWAIALIVLSSCSLAGMLIAAAGYALQALGLSPGSPGASEDGDGDERQPLLIRIDADDCGSVGSADTSDGEDEVDVEEVERRVTRTIERLEHTAEGRSGLAPAAGGGEGAAAGTGRDGGGDAGTAAAAAGPQGAGTDAAAGTEASAGTEAAAEVARQVAESAAAGSCGTQQPQAAASSAAQGREELAAEPGAEVAAVTDSAADEAPANAAPPEAAVAGAAAAAEGEFEEPVKPPRSPGCGLTPEGPLAMVDCVVCMSRPVQVVGIPCGHVCMCRRCSRRLERCPVCRKPLARRQRLYV